MGTCPYWYPPLNFGQVYCKALEKQKKASTKKSLKPFLLWKHIVTPRLTYRDHLLFSHRYLLTDSIEYSLSVFMTYRKDSSFKIFI